jgi:PleD family two-component response regulator
MNEFHNLSLDDLRERVKRIKSEVDALNDLLTRQHFFEKSKQEIKRADEKKFITAEFHD